MIIEKLVEMAMSLFLLMIRGLGKIPILNIPSWAGDFDYFMNIALIFFPQDVWVTIISVVILWNTYTLLYWLIMWILAKIPLVSINK